MYNRRSFAVLHTCYGMSTSVRNVKSVFVAQQSVQMYSTERSFIPRVETWHGRETWTDSIRTYVTHTVGSDSKRVYVKAKCKKKSKGKSKRNIYSCTTWTTERREETRRGGATTSRARRAYLHEGKRQTGMNNKHKRRKANAGII